MAKKVIGIDMGTTNTTIWISGSESVVFDEPTVLAWDENTHEILEIGYLAHKLIGKVPEGTEVVFPLKDGAVADVEATAKYLYRAFQNIREANSLHRAQVILSVPCSLTPVEKDALKSVAKALRITSLHLIEAPLAAAAGSGIDIYSTRGTLMVDIGGALTDIAALALGRIIVKNSIRVAGNTVDEAIARYLRTAHQLSVGPKTAEYIKMKIGTLEENPDNNLIEVSGKSLVNGLPHTLILSTEEISSVIRVLYQQICDAVIDTLGEAPSEVASDILHSGIILCGGGCLLTGARLFFEKKLSTPIHVSSSALTAPIEGIKAMYPEILKGEKEKL